MSGDVQPRKRKDKKKKKDELSIEEPPTYQPNVKGTSAIFGEGDIFMHSQHDHGTGGHWCAKIIFFSLLAVLITLIGLIILENRGLSELEANAVESRYSGVLDGWIEDAPDDDHHDIHTLELNHHDEDDDDHDDAHGSEEDEPSQENQEDDVEDNEEEQENSVEENDDDEDGDGEEDNEENGDVDGDNEENGDVEDPEEPYAYKSYMHSHSKRSITDEDDEYDEEDEDENGEEEDDDELDEGNGYRQADNDDDQEPNSNENTFEGVDQQNAFEDEEEDYQTTRNDDESMERINDEDLRRYLNYENSKYLADEDENDEDFENNMSKEDEDEHDEDDEDDEEEEETEVEHIEKEVEDEEPIKLDLPALPEDDDDDDQADDNKLEEDDIDNDTAEEEDNNASPEQENDDDDDDEFLEYVEPVEERITAPSGQPFKEVDEEDSSEQPPVDTLAEEEEYERRQEELRKEEAQASHLWLKVSVGALLAAVTHALLRRACSRGEDEQDTVVEEAESTPDRRMTLIPEEATPPATPSSETSATKIQQEFKKRIPSLIETAPTPKQVSLEAELEEAEEENDDPVVGVAERSETPIEELYSDEEEIEAVVEAKKEIVKQVAPAAAVKPVAKEVTPEPEEIEEDEEDQEDPDDVEFIEDEQLEDEEIIDEEDDEEEISDVDDAELLSRLEAKYGRLPEPERPNNGGRNKDGGNSVEDTWPGEPDDPFWKAELDKAEDELRQGLWSEAAVRASSQQLATSARARYVVAKSYDELAEAKRDNAVLSRAISAYLELLKLADGLSDERLLEITNRTVSRINFRGIYLRAEPVYRLLIRRFPENPGYRNNLTISFLMANRADLAEKELKETLIHWPEDRVALAHYGFVLKTEHKRVEESVQYLTKALEGDVGPAAEPRFYYHLGDALLLLNRFEEAHEVHKRGAALGHFLSPVQRSLYNVERLKSRPWWRIEDTPYARLAESLEKSWQAILREGLAAKALYEEEREGLREKGEWSQLDLFMRGHEVPGRCGRAPVTCAVVRAEPAAAACRRGQVKFSSMQPGTHVRPHVGPTNCRLRMHLGLSNTNNTFLRVGNETRQWQEGKVFLFDDSFEHEVWHNGTGPRLVLIVDLWHPDLTPAERRQLPAI